MVRSVKYLSWLVLQYVASLLGLGALLIAFYYISTPAAGYDMAAGRITGLVFMCGALFPFILQASMVQTYMMLSLSMSTARRGFFAGMQAAKLLLAAGTCAAAVLIQAAAGLLFGQQALPSGGGMLVAGFAALVLINCCFGETMGVATLRFGKAAMVACVVAMVAVCGGLGGVIGYMGAAGELDGMLNSVLRFLSNVWALCGAAVLCAILLAAADWLMCRRISVKG